MVMDVVFWQLFVSGMQVTDSLIVDFDLLLQRIWPFVGSCPQGNGLCNVSKRGIGSSVGCPLPERLLLDSGQSTGITDFRTNLEPHRIRGS